MTNGLATLPDIETLPERAEDLSKWVLVGEQALYAQVAKLRAVERIEVGVAAREAALSDTQTISEWLLTASARLGEILGKTPANRSKESSTQATSLPSLPDGITKGMSHRLQELFRHPDIVESCKADARERGEIATPRFVLKAIKRAQAQKKTTHAPAAVYEDCVTSLQALIDKGIKFATIYADPPWPYNNQATRSATGNFYNTLTIDQICAEPVPRLAADDAHLHLWTTNAFLGDAITKVIPAWGFTFKSVRVWCKPQLGIGNYWRVCQEYCLFGVRGTLPMSDAHMAMHGWVIADRERHSRKPDVFRRDIELVSPGPRLEMYGREAHDGWAVYGNQIVGLDMFRATDNV